MLLIIFSISCSKNKETINEEFVGEWEWTHTVVNYSRDNGWGSVNDYSFILNKNYTASLKIYKSGKIKLFKDNIHYYTFSSRHIPPNIKLLKDSSNNIIADSLTFSGFPASIFENKNIEYTLTPIDFSSPNYVYSNATNYFKKK